MAATADVNGKKLQPVTTQAVRKGKEFDDDV
jgi:hypothetical protein